MVNIDTVYQRVLALANKEQRGYITPLEYNLLANQAQLDIFEQYFYDRSQTARGPGNNTVYSDVDIMLDEKIDVFKVEGLLTNGLLPVDLYRLGTISTPVGNPLNNTFAIAEEVTSKQFRVLQNTPLLKPTDERPVFVRTNFPLPGTVIAWGTNTNAGAALSTTAQVLADYVRVPAKVEWGYDVIGEKALHNGSPNKTTHFEHHRSEETKLVMRILELAGVIVQDPGLIQYGDSEGMKKIQQEKQ
tara:strand:+ start:607 stop:1341 length:735 start_codon:yes stop_codon:yes gene_type:complete